MAKDFRWKTEVEFDPAPFEISYAHKIMAMGSCFAEHIGQHLATLKYSILQNPFGIQYNPGSLAMGLQRLLQKQPFSKEEIFSYQGLWQSWMHHGSFSHPDAEEYLRVINQGYQAASQHLMQTERLLLTLGTAWIYRLQETGQLVSNCHKWPQAAFNRSCLSVQEIVETLGHPIQQLQVLQPALKIVLTVSPVRHLKDGAIENQRSKANLLLAVQELEQAFDNVYYFPSYEIMMDELRDYRYYASDMLHPSDMAIDYIWSKFEVACLAKGEAQWRRKIAQIVRAAAHRPLHPKRAVHQQFIQQQLDKIKILLSSFPYEISFEAEQKLLMAD